MCSFFNIDKQLGLYEGRTPRIWAVHYIMLAILLFLPIIRLACYLASFGYDYVEPIGYEQTFTYLESLIEDWKRELIVDIQLVGPDGECADPAFNRYWPGTESYKLKKN